MAQSVEVRKRPVQARSRARVESILTAAKQIISESGSDALKMSEIASRADVPIGSIYQFFPNKSSIIHTLAQDLMDLVRVDLTLKFSDFKNRDDAFEKIAQSIDGYYSFFAAQSVVRDIWCSTQGDKQLQDMDIEDSRANGAILFDSLKPFINPRDHASLAATCFLCMQLTGATVRLAVTQDEATAKLMLKQYTQMVRASLERFESA